ncbi:MAG: uracil-DNA glycosylase family protein [Patescibacteria group bacterium]
MNKKALIAQVEANVKNCSKCRLCETALNAVPGEGNINSKIVFIGEAPGATEDKTGRPFVGRAGNLLETLLNEIGYKREDVWIGNIIKHRPPNNRDPLPDEIKACEGYLAMQLKAIDPWVVVTLGRFSMNYFYKDGKITKDHGHPRKIGDLVLYPVYHPAAALRNKSFADALRKDFKRIPKLMEYLNKNGFGKRSSDKTPTSVSETIDGQLGLSF